MAAPITKLRIGLQPDTPEEHTRLLIDVNAEEAQTSLQIATDLRVRANPATAKIYYYNFDGSELLYTETIEPGGNGSWDGEPGRASTAQYEFIFNGWSTEPDQVDPTEDATAGVYSTRRVYAAYKRRDISGFLTFTSTQPFSFRMPATKTWDGTLEASGDRLNWRKLRANIEISSTKDPADDLFKIFVKGNNNTMIFGSTKWAWTATGGIGSIDCQGDVYSLVDSERITGSGDRPQLPAAIFAHLFEGVTALRSAPSLTESTLPIRCCQFMFKGCAGLEVAPELPATTLAEYCYYEMFAGCTGLEAAPELPATTLHGYCYDGMFKGCTGLEAAPELPATTLAEYCYYEMFAGCTSLKAAPELPATTLVGNCYRCMFQGCAGLETAPELPATTLAVYCYREMFMDCSKLKIAPEIMASRINGAGGTCQRMFSGCTSLASLPIFRQAYYASNSLSYAFENCANIRVSESESAEYSIPWRIPESGSGSVQSGLAFDSMFAGTGGTFTGTPVINTTYYLAPPAST